MPVGRQPAHHGEESLVGALRGQALVEPGERGRVVRRDRTKPCHGGVAQPRGPPGFHREPSLPGGRRYAPGYSSNEPKPRTRPRYCSRESLGPASALIRRGSRARAWSKSTTVIAIAFAGLTAASA